MKSKKKWKNMKNWNSVRSITKNSGDSNERYMKMKLNWDDVLPLNKMMEIPSMTIAVFLENNKYYPQVFLDECLYQIQNMESKYKLKEIYDIDYYWYKLKKLIIIFMI